MHQILSFDADDPDALARSMAALDMHSPLIIAGFRYWDSCRRGRQMPARGDIDPLIDVPRLVPNMMLFDVRRENLDFRWRLVGSRARQYLRRDYTGEWFSQDPLYNDPESAVWRAMTLSDREQKPVLLRPKYVGPHKDFIHVENVLLPLHVDREGWGMEMIFMDFIRRPTAGGLHGARSG